MSAPVVTDLSGHKEDNTMILLLVTEEKKEDVTLVTLQKDHLKATIKQAASKRRRQKLVSSWRLKITWQEQPKLKINPETMIPQRTHQLKITKNPQKKKPH